MSRRRRPLSDDLRLALICMGEQLPVITVAKYSGIPVRTIRNLYQKYRKNDGHRTKPGIGMRRGARRTLTVDDIGLVVGQTLEYHRDIYLNVLRDLARECLRVDVDRTTNWRYLHRQEYTMNKPSKTALERNEQRRPAFRYDFGHKSGTEYASIRYGRNMKPRRPDDCKRNRPPPYRYEERYECVERIPERLPPRVDDCFGSFYRPDDRHCIGGGIPTPASLSLSGADPRYIPCASEAGRYPPYTAFAGGPVHAPHAPLPLGRIPELGNGVLVLDELLTVTGIGMAETKREKIIGKETETDLQRNTARANDLYPPLPSSSSSYPLPVAVEVVGITFLLSLLGAMIVPGFRQGVFQEVWFQCYIVDECSTGTGKWGMSNGKPESVPPIPNEI
ncbi:hypothetical protein BT96DRAFT_942610 [Gymnopus androsaceus JB14]|uniref:Uncharacterized protein n=1 Tax=Gymnopus androsaceus JB14 TaxID=1447944 RepID=A0A6A4HD09_9AGAR|nr:hypothetical protein BT96DRAFT_942610 [Gymnopus androsaceus JB14]